MRKRAESLAREGSGGLVVRLFLAICVAVDDTPEHARVPAHGKIAAPKLIQWREGAAPRRARTLVAASTSRHSVPPARPQPAVLQHADFEEPSASLPVPVRGSVIDILV